jgi:CDP-4-dehydro-6-deoxyglucose reductase, E1
MTRKYSLASNTWDEKEKLSILRVLESNQFTMGKEVDEFENMFSEYLGTKHSIMVNSGSSANLLACAAFKLSGKYKNGTVIAPAVSWSTTFFPISQWGYKIKFLDINIRSLNIDIAEIKKNITTDVVGICGVSLLGNPSGMDEIRNICNQHNLFFFEDNCESFGASIKGILAGSFGDISTHSFFFSHHMQTMEGGMVSTNDDALASIIRSLRAHGWTRDKKSGDLSDIAFDNFSKSFEFIYPGYCVRPIEFMGAVGKVQLSKWPLMKQKRLENAFNFKKMMSEFNEIFTIQSDQGVESTWFGFSIILIGKATGNRSLLVNIFEKHNIEYRPIVAGNFTKQKVIQYLNHFPLSNYPNADQVDENGIFVGNDSRDLRDELSLLKDALLEFSLKL